MELTTLMRLLNEELEKKLDIFKEEASDIEIRVLEKQIHRCYLSWNYIKGLSNN